MLDSSNTTLILGGPGCGKTTRLLEIVSAELASGIRPSEIAFVAFTKAAAEEAKERAGIKFGLDPEYDLPYFRTIHSLAYMSQGMSHEEVMNAQDWRTFGEMVGEPMKGSYESDDGLIPSTVEGGRNIGDLMLRIVDYASTTCQTLEDTWRELDHPIEWFRLKRFSDSLEKYKADVGKSDFTDMLHNVLQFADPLKNVRVAVVDEAQDLTAAQWRVIEHAFGSVDRLYIGGDDDQAIYRWAGADVDHFLALQGRQEILPLSHRLTKPVYNIAQGIVHRISHRWPKQYTPDLSRAGNGVHWYRSPDDVYLRSGEWLIIARNGYLLRDMERMCEQRGYAYSTRHGSSVDPDHVRMIQLWARLSSGRTEKAPAEDFRALAKVLGRPKPPLKDTVEYAKTDFMDWPWGAPWHRAFVGIASRRRDYYVNCLRTGERLAHEPRLRIETIHGVKGAERDNVLMLTDISARTHESLMKDPDHEHRVFYVGVTRARESLHLVEPQSTLSYQV